jgi:hypothetical protein
MTAIKGFTWGEVGMEPPTARWIPGWLGSHREVDGFDVWVSGRATGDALPPRQHDVDKWMRYQDLASACSMANAPFDWTYVQDAMTGVLVDTKAGYWWFPSDHDDDWQIQCVARTTKGARCLNDITEYRVVPETWVRQRCHVHIDKTGPDAVPQRGIFFPVSAERRKERSHLIRRLTDQMRDAAGREAHRIAMEMA